MLAYKGLLLAIVLVVACTEPNGRPLKGGCRGTRYGCCEDGKTSAWGPNKENFRTARLIGGCKDTRYGCCSDGVTTAAGENKEGCA